MNAVTYVRRAKTADVPWLMTQLQKFSDFFGTKKSLFSHHAHRQLHQLLETHPFFVAAVNGRPVGFIAGALHPHPYNPDIRVLTEMLWWVAETERGSRAGLMLLEEFLRYGEKHADWIVFTLETNSPVNERCLTKRGFRLHEKSYLREVSRD